MHLIDGREHGSHTTIWAPQTVSHPIDGTECGPHTTPNRELVSMLEDTSQAWGSNPRPLNPLSVTLPWALLYFSFLTWIEKFIQHSTNCAWWHWTILYFQIYVMTNFNISWGFHFWQEWDIALIWCNNRHPKPRAMFINYSHIGTIVSVSLIWLW